MRRSGISVAVALLALASAAAPSLAAPAGSTQLVSRPDGLGPVPPAFDNRSGDMQGAISADGRYAAFLSYADGFADGTDPRVVSVLLRDTQAGTTTLVSRGDGPLGLAADRDAGEPALAVAPAGVMPDAPLGQPHVLVVFTTGAANLVDHATGLAQSVGLGRSAVWLRDATAGTTYLVSRADGAGGAIGDADSARPAIDVGPAGPVIGFFSNAQNLGVRNAGSVFLRTFNAADTQLIACRGNNCGGTPEGSRSVELDVRVVAPDNATLCTAIGHPTGCVLVAFATSDTTITNDPGGRSQIAVALADAGTTNTGVPRSLFLESRPNGSGTLLGDGESTAPSLSGDGRAVAFISTAGNLTGDALPASPQQAYVRSLAGSSTRLLSRADGAGAAADNVVVSVALGGGAANLRAAFVAIATNLGSPNGADTYLRDDVAGRTSLINRAAGPAGAPGDSGSGAPPAVSADGGSALFASSAHNLGDDLAPFPRVHVRRLDSGALELVSRPDGTAPFATEIAQSSVSQGAVSDDARFVAFGSTSGYGILPSGTSRVWVRDLLTGRTTLVSRASGSAGAPADATASAATISGDGRFVAFSSSAGNLVPGTPPRTTEVYVRDLATQTTTLVSRANGATGTPSPALAAGATISRDGRAVVFVTAAVLDPAGANGRQHVYVRDLAAQTTTLVDRDDGAAGAVAAGNGFEAALDADGSRVAWVTDAALAGTPAGRLRVYRRDLAAGRTVLVSRADGAAGAAADQDSRFPSIDADGARVAFRSDAGNFGERPLNGQFYVRDAATGTTQLVSRASGPAGLLPSSVGFAAIDADGQRVAFSAIGQFGDGAPSSTYETYLRDLPTQTTTLVSRADGPLGAPADGDAAFTAIDAGGGCVAFASSSTNLGDGFDSADFDAIHMRALRGECPHVQAGPPGGPGPGPVVPISRPRPVLGRLAVRPKRFHVGGRRGGTRISFTLDRAASVTLAFDRLKPGRRAKGRCRARARRGRRCTIVTRAGSLIVNGRTGANSIVFSGRLGRRALARGRYRLTATPSGGRAQTAGFSVVAAPRRRHRARAHR